MITILITVVGLSLILGLGWLLGVITAMEIFKEVLDKLSKS
jgi:hypothetical protein